jgi:hypothetical protein
LTGPPADAGRQALQSRPGGDLTANPAYEAPASGAGADRFMTKPLSLEALSEAIGQLVGWDPGAQAGAQA